MRYIDAILDVIADGRRQGDDADRLDERVYEYMHIHNLPVRYAVIDYELTTEQALVLWVSFGFQKASKRATSWQPCRDKHGVRFAILFRAAFFEERGRNPEIAIVQMSPPAEMKSTTAGHQGSWVRSMNSVAEIVKGLRQNLNLEIGNGDCQD